MEIRPSPGNCIRGFSGCQWQPPSLNWLKPTSEIYCLTGLKQKPGVPASGIVGSRLRQCHEDSALRSALLPSHQLHPEMLCGIPRRLKAYSLLPAGNCRGKRASPSQGPSLTPFCGTVIVQGEGSVDWSDCSHGQSFI